MLQSRERKQWAEHGQQKEERGEHRGGGKRGREERGAREGSRESQEPNKWVENQETIRANGRFT